MKKKSLEQVEQISNQNNIEETTHGRYRIQPTFINSLVVILVYIVIVIGLEKLSGIRYTDFDKDAHSLVRGILIPVSVATFLLTVFSLWSGWSKDIWRDRLKIKGYWWLNLFLIFNILIIASLLLVGNIANMEPNFVALIALTCLLVGYSEETISRGFLVNGARNAGFSEVKVMFISMAFFSLLHSVNIFLGQDVGTTVVQMIQAAFMGGIFFIILKKSGYLIVPILVHGMFDFAIFTNPDNHPNLLGLPLTFLMYIMLAFAIIPLKKCNKLVA